MTQRIIVLPEQLEVLQDRIKRIEKLLNNQQPNVSDPILDSEKVMQFLKVSRRCLQNWRDNGVIEFSAVGGKFYYRLSAINKMLERNAVNKGVQDVI